MKHITEDCEVTVVDGEISVDYRHEREVTITDSNGIQRLPASSVIPGLSRNWWTANWSGSQWNLDLDCGCQRFNGVTTTRRINEALKVAGLDAAKVKAVVSAAKKRTHFSVGRKA
jgi:hypothetical protein